MSKRNLIFVIAVILMAAIWQVSPKLNGAFNLDIPQAVRAVQVSNNELLQGTIYLPETSIVTTGSGQAVWIEQDGTATLQPVTLGDKIGNLVQVFGLSTGKVVIIDTNLSANQTILPQIINQSTADEAGLSGKVL
jgi:hypothetical protein